MRGGGGPQDRESGLVFICGITKLLSPSPHQNSGLLFLENASLAGAYLGPDRRH